jgi:Tfp pilus assembly protein PilN
LNTAGLNIEGKRLQIAVVRKGFGRVSHLHSEELEIPDVEPERTEALREALLRLKKDFNIKQAVFGIELGLSANFTLELPALKKEDMRSALVFELEKHLPLMPEEYAFDYARFPLDRAKLLVLAARNDSVNWIKEAVNGSGIKLAGIRCAFLELLLEFARTEKKNALFAYKNKEELNMASLEQGWPLWMKSVPIETGLAELAGKEAFIAGDTGQSSGMHSFPKSTLLPSFVLAYNRKSPLRLNFEPGGQVKKDYYNYALSYLAAAALCFFLFTPVAAYFKVARAERQVNREMDSLKSTAHELVEIRRDLEGIKRKKEFLLAAKAQMNGPIRAFAAMSAALPRESWLWNFSMDEKGKIEIKGFAKSAAQLIKPLEDSPLFKNVEFSAPVQAREGWERFSIKMEMEK